MAPPFFSNDLWVPRRGIPFTYTPDRLTLSYSHDNSNSFWCTEDTFPYYSFDLTFPNNSDWYTASNFTTAGTFPVDTGRLDPASVSNHYYSINNAIMISKDIFGGIEENEDLCCRSW